MTDKTQDLIARMRAWTYQRAYEDITLPQADIVALVHALQDALKERDEAQRMHEDYIRAGAAFRAQLGAQRDAMADALNGLPVSEFMASFPQVQAACDLRQLAQRLAKALKEADDYIQNERPDLAPEPLLSNPAVQALLKDFPKIGIT